ncbi:hypothetical protein [uncultured Arthrobacter sp.]|uniref:hypothetical protein n=1 Tax=uncultured Arthrobacter sp. TaxID=114050 RepID=UPI003216D197
MEPLDDRTADLYPEVASPGERLALFEFDQRILRPLRLLIERYDSGDRAPLIDALNLLCNAAEILALPGLDIVHPADRAALDKILRLGAHPDVERPVVGREDV